MKNIVILISLVVSSLFFVGCGEADDPTSCEKGGGEWVCSEGSGQQENCQCEYNL